MNPEKKRRLSELSNMLYTTSSTDGDASSTVEHTDDAANVSVVRFQKDAVWRELQVQRQSLTDVERRCRHLENTIARQGRNAAWIDRVWRQTLIELDRVLRKLVPATAADASTSYPPSFLQWVVGVAGTPADSKVNGTEWAPEHGRGGDGDGLPDLLVHSVNQSRDELARSLARLETFEQRVSAALTGNDASHTSISPAYVAQLERQHQQATAKLLELEEAVATAQASADAANIRVEELAISLEQARRHVERQAAQLAAATSLATQTASAALAAQTAASSGTASPSSIQSALNRTATASALANEPFGLSLTDELELARSLAADRLQEVSALRAQKEALINEVDKLRYELIELPQHIVESTPAYRSLLQTLDNLRRDATEARTAEADWRSQLDVYLAQRHAFVEEMEKQKGVREAALEAELRAAQNELIRLRSDRDSLRLANDQMAARIKPAETVAQESQTLATRLLDENKEIRAQLLEIRKNGLGDRPEMALLKELESIGKALEDMQEQNKQLTKLMRERDEANSRLFADLQRAKMVQTQASLTRDRDLLKAKTTPLQKVIKTQADVIQKAEARERLQQQQLVALEKEGVQRSSMVELHKRKAIELSQQVSDLQIRLDKHNARTGELQAQLAERTALAEREANQSRRLQEEAQGLRKRVEKLEKVTVVTDESLRVVNEALLEKVKCSVCKKNDKAVVITRCFHCFCESCVKTRLETRQRKCPACAETFGNNDVQKIYLAS